MNAEEFSKMVLDRAEQVRPRNFKPIAEYDPDGDCIEFLAAPDSFYAERVDDLITVYYSHITNEIIGSLIKQFSRFQKDVLSRFPGFHLSIRGPDTRGGGEVSNAKAIELLWKLREKLEDVISYFVLKTLKEKRGIL